MVAFVDDYVPIVTNTVVHNTFANEALDDGHIEQTGRCLSATADSTNRLCRYVQEGRETLDPLVEELPPMHEHQRAGVALCDQPGGNHRFPEGCRCGQDTGLMLQHRIGRELLLGSQLTVKRRLQRLSIVTFVADDHANVQVRQDLTNICQAAARETDVMRIFLGAADDAWLVVCWQPHRLRLVEFWILECRDTQQPVSQPRRQSVPGDVDLVAEDELKRLREVTSNRQLLSAS